MNSSGLSAQPSSAQCGGVADAFTDPNCLRSLRQKVQEWGSTSSPTHHSERQTVQKLFSGGVTMAGRCRLPVVSDGMDAVPHALCVAGLT